MPEPYQQEMSEVVGALGTDSERGLRESNVRARLEQHGPNELAAEKPPPAWRRFLAQFQDVLVILLLVATAISAGLWIYRPETALPYEAIAIFAVVLLNSAMADHAEVIRDGERLRLPATQLVPGDLVLIEEGDRVPADARVVESTALQTAEAALTGESLPVSKEVGAIAGDVLDARFERLGEVPFSSERKLMRAVRPGARRRLRAA